jgi:hypothetical protein
MGVEPIPLLILRVKIPFFRGDCLPFQQRISLPMFISLPDVIKEVKLTAMLSSKQRGSTQIRTGDLLGFNETLLPSELQSHSGITFLAVLIASLQCNQSGSTRT